MTAALLAGPPASAPATEAVQTVDDVPERRDPPPGLPRGDDEHREAPTTTTTAPPPTTTTTRPNAGFVPSYEGAKPEPGPCGGYEDLVEAHFGPAAGQACSVIRCETAGTFDPGIYNASGSGASGLFQFMPGTWESTTGTPPPAAAYPAEAQIAAGAALWRASGWAPWSCRP